MDIAEALRGAGLDVVEYRGWATRGRPGKFRARGVLVHHTGPWSTVAGMVALCTNGRSDLPGPLCHVVLDPDGTCHVIASGRANHAGKGEWGGLTDGNGSFYGIEAIHNGARATPWPAEQMAGFVLCAAALARLAGAPAAMVAAHREYALPAGRKPDPVAVDMVWFRARVAAWLDRWDQPGAGPACPGPAQQCQEVDAVRLTSYFHPVPSLDGEGRGWIDIPFPTHLVLDLCALGSSPPDEGYWPPVVVTRQDRGAVTRVTLAGAPGQGTGLHYKVAETD